MSDPTNPDSWDGVPERAVALARQLMTARYHLFVERALSERPGEAEAVVLTELTNEATDNPKIAMEVVAVLVDYAAGAAHRLAQEWGADPADALATFFRWIDEGMADEDDSAE